jgi:glycosyltransferase involved in cell wall biosynthesis
MTPPQQVISLPAMDVTDLDQLLVRDSRVSVVPPHLAFCVSDLNTGGVQHAVLRISGAMASIGCRVSVLICEPGGKLEKALSPKVEPVWLPISSKLYARAEALRADPGAWRLMLRPLLSRRETRTLPYLPALTAYLREYQPDTLFTAAPALNVWGYLAKRRAGVATRLVVSERTHFSAGKPRKIERKQVLAPLMGRAYAGADRVAAVSHGVARDLVANVGVARDHITVLHNPTIGPDFAERMAAPVDHPWFQPGEPPVLLAVGRLAGQKDLPTLLAAFARAQRQRPMRLVLLGEKNPAARVNKSKASVAEMIEAHGIGKDIELLGYDPNPIRYMARADLFILSSRFEGFPNVLLEAVASGCPVVSTDCPSGPYELLDGGRFGRLVPVGDPDAMAEAILASLEAPIDRSVLKERARLFDFEHSVTAYRNVLLGQPQLDTYPEPRGWR